MLIKCRKSGKGTLCCLFPRSPEYSLCLTGDFFSLRFGFHAKPRRRPAPCLWSWHQRWYKWMRSKNDARRSYKEDVFTGSYQITWKCIPQAPEDVKKQVYAVGHLRRVAPVFCEDESSYVACNRMFLYFLLVSNASMPLVSAVYQGDLCGCTRVGKGLLWQSPGLGTQQTLAQCTGHIIFFMLSSRLPQTCKLCMSDACGYCTLWLVHFVTIRSARSFILETEKFCNINLSALLLFVRLSLTVAYWMFSWGAKDFWLCRCSATWQRSFWLPTLAYIGRIDFIQIGSFR